MKAVLASYTLSLAVFIPVSGWMATGSGRGGCSPRRSASSRWAPSCAGSRSIHLLVACRVLQGCGGAMMVPVGRLTLVRTFAKSELVRAMSFVAIPSLIGPMLGPARRRLIVALPPLAA
jgi:MFS family permease